MEVSVVASVESSVVAWRGGSVERFATMRAAWEFAWKLAWKCLWKPNK